MQLVMSGLGVLIMIGICGLSGFFIVADKRHAHGAHAADIDTVRPASASVSASGDIGSRSADPAPLAVDEVFPAEEIVMVPGATPYQLRLKHIDTDCPVAATGSLAQLLQDHGCSQVVRATLVAPVAGYLVTAGVFNLSDEAGARTVSKQVKPLMDSGRGGFAGMVAGPGTEPVETPSAQVGWHSRGHYLLYCVIARPDGRAIREGDPYAEHIVFDLVESYLRDGVLGRRAAAAA